MLEIFSKRIEENQRNQNENLRRYIDSTVGRVDSKVDEITTYQTSQKATVQSITRFVTDIGAAKKPNQTLHFDLSNDDSLDVNAPQGAKPKVRLSDHETMINTRRGAMGFASTPASKAPTQPNFNLTRVVRDANNSTHGAIRLTTLSTRRRTSRSETTHTTADLPTLTEHSTRRIRCRSYMEKFSAP